MENAEVRLHLENAQEATAIFGRNDEFLRLIAERYAAARILTRRRDYYQRRAETNGNRAPVI